MALKCWPNKTGVAAFEGYISTVNTPQRACGEKWRIAKYCEFSAPQARDGNPGNTVRTNRKSVIRREYTHMRSPQKVKGPGTGVHALLKIFVCQPTGRRQRNLDRTG